MKRKNDSTKYESLAEFSDDDFLVEEGADDKDAFKMATVAPAPYRLNRMGTGGDKSKGWATQKQRPGEWKRKIQRR